MKNSVLAASSRMWPAEASLFLSLLAFVLVGPGAILPRASAQETQLPPEKTGKKLAYGQNDAKQPSRDLSALQEDPEAPSTLSESEPEKPVRKSPVEGWRFELTPVLWAAEMDGKLGIGPVSAEGTISFSDILEDLDLGAMFHAEVGWNRFGLLLDGMYIRLEDDLSAGPLKVETTIEQTIFQFAPSFRLGPLELPDEKGEESSSIWNLWILPEVFAGGRYVHVDGELDPALLPSRDREKDWIDPIVGARVGFGITRRLSVYARGDIGGFGAASDLTWNAIASVNFQVHEHFVLVGGYKVLDWDFDDGSFDFNSQLRGPFLGVRIGF